MIQKPKVQYQIYVKVRNGASSTTHRLETTNSLAEAEKLAEEYALGKEAAFVEYPLEAINQPKISFFPLSVVEAVYVIPEPKKEN